MNAVAAPATWQHEQAAHAETVEALIRAALDLMTQQRVDISPSKLSRLIRKRLRSGETAANVMSDLEYFALSYRDDTGETAVHNLLTGKTGRAA